MTTVVIADTTQGLKEALDEVFALFGGVRGALPPRGGTLYVKPNGIHFSPHRLWVQVFLLSRAGEMTCTYLPFT